MPINQNNNTENNRSHIDSFPKATISRQQFDKLSEYSLSNPTVDKTIKKFKYWKYRTPLNAEVEDAIWFGGIYNPYTDKVNFYFLQVI